MIKFEKGDLSLKPADVKNAHCLALKNSSIVIVTIFELTNGDTIVHYNDSVLSHDSITGENFRTQIVAPQIADLTADLTADL